MTMLGLLTAYLVLFIGGGGVAAMLLSGSRRINPIELFSLAWLFGVGVISLLLWVCATFCSGTLLLFLVTLVALLIGAMGCWVFRKTGCRFHWPVQLSTLEWFLVAVLVMQAGAIFYASCKHTLGWDGLLVWEIKARYAFLNNGVLPTQYLRDSSRVFSHPDYPLALPLNQLWIYLWIGEANQFWAKTIFPIFYAVGTSLLAILGSRLTGSRLLGFLIAGLLFFVPQVTVGTGGTLVGYADFPLGIFYLATVGYLLCALRQRLPGSFAIFAASLALLPWIKKEGTILWAVALLGGLAVIIIQRRSYRTCLALLPGLVLILAWKIFLRAASAAESLDFVTISASALRANCGRIVGIYGAIFHEMTTTEHWGIFWGIVAIAALCALWNWRQIIPLFLLTSICLPLAIYSFSYVFSSWPQYLDHVGSSITRLTMQFIPVAWLLIGTAAARTAVEQKKVLEPG
jgi:hypothetical protein